MKRKLKRIMAVLLCLLIITGTVITDNIQAKATAIPVEVGGSALLKAIVGASAAYAGYKATKSQLNRITSIVSAVIKDYTGRIDEVTEDEFMSEDDYNAYCVSLWIRHPYQTALVTFSKKLYQCAVKKAEEHREQIRLELIEGGKNNPNGNNNPDINAAVNAAVTKKAYDIYKRQKETLEQLLEGKINNYDDSLISNGIGAQVGVQVALNIGFTSAMSGLVDEIIKKDFNADYEKAKGKYDWEKLGFKSDFDTLEISKSSTEQFSDYSKLSNRFNANNTLIRTSIGDVTTLLSVPCGSEKTALVTIRNPTSGKWKTVFLTEKQLYYFVNSVKSGAYTFSDVNEIITSSYMELNDKSLPTFPLGSINKKSGYSDYAGNECFFSSFAIGEYVQNPLTVKYVLNQGICDSTDASRYVYLQKTNTTVYNIGKTMNVYFWNFASETEYIGSTTALNGLEDVQPAVKNSIFTNTADEINKKSDITIDTDKDYDDTDEQISDIARDNDLDLQVIEDNTGEITDNTKGIWETVKSILGSITSLPRKIYNFFSGILNKILNAVKANPLSLWNYLQNPITQLVTGVNAIAEQSGLNISIPDLTNIDFWTQRIGVNTGTASVYLNDIMNRLLSWDNIPANLARIITLNENGGLTLGNIYTALTTNIQPVIDSLLSTVGSIYVALPTGLQSSVNALSVTVGNIFTSLGSLADNVANPIVNTLTALFVPDTVAINNAINDLKDNFSFVNDFKGIVKSVIDTAVEPHDYITIYNWNKDGNKYDKRDSYRIYFTWYTPYRPYVNAIIIALVYLIFVWRIFIKLPSIISGTGGGIESVFGMSETANDIVSSRQQVFKNGGD